MKRFPGFTAITAASFLLCAILPANLQAQKTNPPRTSDLSNEDWNAWRVGVTTFEEANTCFLSQEYAKAIALYEKSLSLFRTVQKNKPHWNKKGLQNRITMIEQKIAASKQRMAEAEKKTKKTTEDKVLEQKIADANAEATAEIADLKMQMETLQKQNLRYRSDLEKARETARQVETLLAENEALEKKYALLLLQYNSLLEKGKNEQSENERALQAAYETAKKKIAELEAKITENEKKHADLNAKNQQLKKTGDSAAKTIADAERRAATATGLEQRLLKLQEQLLKSDSAHAEQIKAKETEIAQLRADLAKKTRELEETAEALSNARNKMDLDNATRHIEQEAEKQKIENEKLQKQLTEYEKQLKELSEKLKVQVASTEQAKEMARNLTEQNKRLAAEIQVAKKNAEKSLADLKKMTEQYQKMNTEAEKLRKERDEFAEQLKKRPVTPSTSDEAKQAQQNADIQSMTKKIADLTAELEKKQAEIKNQNNATQTLTQTIVIQKQKIAALEKEQAENTKKLEYYAKLKVEYESLVGIQEQLRASQMENKILKAENEKIKKADISAELKKDLERVKADIAKHNNEYGRQKEALDELNRRHTELQTAHAALQKQYESAVRENNTLKGDVKTLNEWKARMLSEEQQKQMQNTLAEREKQIAELKKAIAEVSAREAKCLSEMEKQKTEMEKLTDKMKNAEPQLLALQEKLSQAEKNAAVTQADKNAMLEKIKQLEQNLQKVNAEKNADLAKIQQADKELKKAIADKNATLEKVKQLETELNRTKAELEKAPKAQIQSVPPEKVQQLELEVKKLNDDKRELEQKLAKTPTLEKIQQLEQDIQKLNDEKIALQKELAKKMIANAVPTPTPESTLKLEQKEKKIQELTDEVNRLRKQINTIVNKSGGQVMETIEKDHLLEKAKLQKKLADQTELTAKLESKVTALENEKKNNQELKEKEIIIKANEEKLAKAKEENRKQAETIQDLNRKVERMEKGRQDVEEQLDEALKKNQVFQNELKKWNVGVDKIAQGKIAEKDIVIDKILGENKELEEKLARKNTRISEINAELTAERKKIVELMDENARLKRGQYIANPIPRPSEKITINPVSAPKEIPADKVKQIGSMKVEVQEAKKQPEVKESAPAPAPATPKENPEQIAKKYNAFMKAAENALAKKDIDDAIWNYLQAADVDQQKGEPHMALAKLYLQIGKPDSADKEYRKALARNMARDLELEKKLQSPATPQK